MKTRYFKIAFNYTEDDIKQAREEYYSAEIDGGYFEAPPSETIIKIECGNNENAFDKLAKIMAEIHVGSRYYIESVGKPVTITDITEEHLAKIKENEAKEKEFQETLKQWGLI